MRPFTLITVVLLAAMAAMHLLRIVFAVEVSVAGDTLPMWPSVLATLVPAALAVGLWSEHRT